MGEVIALDAHAEPDVGIPLAPVRRQVIGNPLGALAQDLKDEVGQRRTTSQASSRQASAAS